MSPAPGTKARSLDPDHLRDPGRSRGADRRLRLRSQGDRRAARTGPGGSAPAAGRRAIRFPEADLGRAAAIFAGLPGGARVLVDGLAYGAMPALAEREGGAPPPRRARAPSALRRERASCPADVERLLGSERAALAHARAVVCTSAATGRRLVAGFGVPAERLTVAAPGTDPAPRAPGLGDPPLIVSIGSLIPRKRHDVLVSALAQDCGAAVAGADHRLARPRSRCATALAAQVAAAGLGDRVDACRFGRRHAGGARGGRSLRARQRIRGLRHGLRRGAVAGPAGRGLPRGRDRGARARRRGRARRARRRDGARRRAGPAPRRSGPPTRRGRGGLGGGPQTLPGWEETAARVAAAVERA